MTLRWFEEPHTNDSGAKLVVRMCEDANINVFA